MINSNKFVFGIFALLLAVSFASATVNLSVNTALPSLVNDSTNYNLILNVTNNDNDAVNISWAKTVSPSAVTITLPANTILGANQSALVSFNYSIPAGLTGAITSTVFATANNSQTANQSASTTAQITPSSSTNFCDFGNVGSNLSITDFNINNNGEGEDDDWYLLDDLEIEVEVSNNGNNKISDVEVEIAIFSGSEDVTDDFDLEDEKIDLGSIKDDDEETATFVINEIPADMGEGSYTVKVKAYAKGKESTQCKQDSDSIQVTNPFGEGVIVFGGALDNQVEATAGQSLDEISFDAINLGDSKEDDVLITIYNKELGIDAQYHISDLRSGDSEAVYFPLIEIPSSATSKVYKIDVETYFDYDDGDVLSTNSYDQNSYDDLEDDYNSFSFNIKVTGTATQTPSNTQDRPTLNARLTSDAQVGKEMIVEVSVKNNIASQMSTLLTANNYNSWAELKSINSSSLSLNGGEIKTAVLTFLPTQAGQQTFEITVLYNGKTISQPITVNVAEKSSGLSSIFGSGSSKAATYLITGIIILVILIIVVLVLKSILTRKE